MRKEIGPRRRAEPAEDPAHRWPAPIREKMFAEREVVGEQIYASRFIWPAGEEAGAVSEMSILY